MPHRDSYQCNTEYLIIKVKTIWLHTLVCEKSKYRQKPPFLVCLVLKDGITFLAHPVVLNCLQYELCVVDCCGVLFLRLSLLVLYRRRLLEFLGWCRTVVPFILWSYVLTVLHCGTTFSCSPNLASMVWELSCCHAYDICDAIFCHNRLASVAKNSSFKFITLRWWFAVVL